MSVLPPENRSVDRLPPTCRKQFFQKRRQTARIAIFSPKHRQYAGILRETPRYIPGRTFSSLGSRVSPDCHNCNSISISNLQLSPFKGHRPRPKPCFPAQPAGPVPTSEIARFDHSFERGEAAALAKPFMRSTRTVRSRSSIRISRQENRRLLSGKANVRTGRGLCAYRFSARFTPTAGR